MGLATRMGYVGLRALALAAVLAITTAVTASAGSRSVGGQQPANVDVTNKKGEQSTTTVAVNPTNPLDILTASNDFTDALTAQVYESLDGGAHWSRVSTGIADGIAAKCASPWLHFNAVGDAFFAYECTAPEDAQEYAFRLHGHDNWVLTTFPRSMTGVTPLRDTITTDDTPSSPFYRSTYIGYDDDNENAGFAAYVLYSRDGITNWTRSPQINDAGGTFGVNVAVAPDGTLYASWLDWEAAEILVDRSLDGGKTWGTDHVVHTFVMPMDFRFMSIPPMFAGVAAVPVTAVGPAGTPHAGRLYEMFEDMKAGGGTDWNVWATFSDDGGGSWSPPIEVNDDAGDAWQFHPAVAIDPAGTVGLSWYDTRRDPNGKKTDQFFSASTDGGATWSANQRITSVQSDESGNGGDLSQYGSYEGIASAAVGVFSLVWTDARRVARNLANDMFWAEATVP